MTRNQRTDTDYTIDAALRTLRVLEALEGTKFEPVTAQRVQQRTGFTYDFCMRALRTLKVAGFAEQTPKGWTMGPKLLKFSERFNETCLAALSTRTEGSPDGR
jgi:DNA-binding IclR family transcriptional regulator